MTNWKSLQGIESTIDGVKARRGQGDVNIRQMTMASWHASLSRGGQSHPPRNAPKGQGALADRKKK